MKRSEGTIGDMMVTGICILAMTVVMIAYFSCVSLFQQKVQVGQIARKYILKMETVGCLLPDDRTRLVQELGDLGITEIDLGDTTLNNVGFGHPIVLDLRGKLKGVYEFAEYRTSTAKN